ncbi:MAG: hypothetical protein QXP31_04095 [Pyrobaculum sp.]
MPVDYYAAVWAALKEVFTLVAGLLAAMGLGEYGGRVVAALLIASFFYLTGVFKKTRRIVGLLLALAVILAVLGAYFK